MEKPVAFLSDGLRLYGVLGLPPAPASRGVVLIHGWSGYRIGPHQMLVETARHLEARGFATLRFDLRGRGDSEGEDAETDLDGMIADTLVAVRFLREMAAVRAVALLGICSGANVAIGAATLEPDIRDLVLWSVLPFQPQVRKSDHLRRTRFFAIEYARRLFRRETWEKLRTGRVDFRAVRWALFSGGGRAVGRRNLKDSRRDIMAAFAGFRGRALFVHGDKDPDAARARAVFMPFCRAHGLNAQFHLIEGASHSYYSLAWKQRLITLTTNWLLSCSTSPEGPT